MLREKIGEVLFFNFKKKEIEQDFTLWIIFLDKTLGFTKIILSMDLAKLTQLITFQALEIILGIIAIIIISQPRRMEGLSYS